MPEEKPVMGYWDCPYCDTHGIKGTLRECPNCGKPRGEGADFYMKARNHDDVVSMGEYLSDAEAARKGKGEDWLCSYCGGLNSVLDAVCMSCGHARDDADAGYAQMRERAEAKKATEKSVAPDPAAARTASGPPLKRTVGIAIAVLAAIAIAIFIGTPRVHEFHVESKSWEYSTDIEEYLYVDEDGWFLPGGADLVRSADEVHHFDRVFDHYETKERSYHERVASGSHVEYTYRNNGDGTFTEVPHTVTDYTYETRHETYREPVYRDVPVFQTKYYYKIWRWMYKTTVVNAGNGDEEPYYPSPELGEDEREGARRASYALHGHYDNDMDDIVVLDVDEQRYFATESGNVLAVETDIAGNFRRFADGG